ncbi:GNAT family N-acetyltransferase [Sphingomonas sp. PP-CE-1G-424]|uniref:GNAT family N-acetyltransferase n=1 Tax=Sphingomonas sp. PP-CE-1G-424 TaxID=2135658 RepID=UPI0010EA098A|nr:GNAT family N-acetyltransferase [Sphingomonas sp. PP-CE-1G-424]TCP65594.1 RimJ/RimL family protein N-acetyltransferase [Sphingomonas sp. PP-CE-1G-424]
MEHPLIETDRLFLRPHVADDAEAVYTLARDQAVLQFIRGLPTTREDAWHRLLRYAGHWSLLGFGMFAVLERETGCFIGEVGLADFRRGLGSDFDSAPEAAWLFTGTVHGKGLAGEAMQAMFNWFDRERRHTRCVCIIDPGNLSSVKLATKLGFTRYGNGRYRDAAVEKYERV